MAIFRHVTVFIAGINYSMQRMFYDVISYFICLHILKLNISVNSPMENDFDRKLFVNKVTSYQPIASLQQWAFEAKTASHKK